MKVVYNPKDGAPIKNFIHEKIKLDPHYPDGYEYRDNNGKAQISNGLMQYLDDQAREILLNYQFLEELSSEKVKSILDRPAVAPIKCDFPGCTFSTHTKVALFGHKRTHAKELGQANQPVVDPSVIPVAQGQKITVAERKEVVHNEDVGTGTDRDGVEWYGEGTKIENFQKVRPQGKGHFIG